MRGGEGGGERARSHSLLVFLLLLLLFEEIKGQESRLKSKEEEKEEQSFPSQLINVPWNTGRQNNDGECAPSVSCLDSIPQIISQDLDYAMVKKGEKNGVRSISWPPETWSSFHLFISPGEIDSLFPFPPLPFTQPGRKTSALGSY